MFEWDEANRAHVRRHGVEPAECEQALADPSVRLVEENFARAEWRAAMIGKTAAGRILVVVWTPRGDRVRVITAYPARGPRRRRYEEAQHDG